MTDFMPGSISVRVVLSGVAPARAARTANVVWRGEGGVIRGGFRAAVFRDGIVKTRPGYDLPANFDAPPGESRLRFDHDPRHATARLMIQVHLNLFGNRRCVESARRAVPCT
jgi:hypothetical protein